MPSSDCFFNFTGRHFFRFAETLPLGDSGDRLGFIVEVDVSCFSNLLLFVDNCCNAGNVFCSKLVRDDSLRIQD